MRKSSQKKRKGNTNYTKLSLFLTRLKICEKICEIANSKVQTYCFYCQNMIQTIYFGMSVSFVLLFCVLHVTGFDLMGHTSYTWIWNLFISI